ncbi:MAG: type II secretion system F family protein [Synergistaceae bacterium]|nr:type II secretion system F family protein [Synergistaceae bacterium]
MAFYQFTAIKNSNDEIVSGEIQAQNEADALVQIRKTFDNVVSLEEVTAILERKNNKSNKFSWRLLHSKHVSVGEKAMMFRRLYMLISAGMSNADAIAILKDSEGNLVLKEILTQIFNSVKRGCSLSVAAKGVPNFLGGNVLALLQVGDETGHMEDVLKNIAQYLEEVATTRKNLAIALAYPIFLLTSFFLVFFIIVLYCVPRFEKAFEPIIKSGGLPFVSRIIFAVSDFICNHYFICVICVFLPIFIVFHALRGKWQDKLYFIPLVKKSFMAAAMRNLSLLILSNVSAVKATALVAEESNCSQIKEIFSLATDSLEKGEAIDEALGNHLTRLDKSLLSVGVTGAKLGEVCRLISLQYKTEAEVLQKKFLSLLEPCLVLLIGLLVALVAFGIYLPCIKMIEEISM